MGRKRRDRAPSGDMPPLSSRIDWLLKHIWHNNIAAMARELGVSHTALSRVLAGQMPSAKMLEALANRADVNTRWLLSGQGQQPPEGANAVGGVFWPVVTQLLPGEPRQHPELLTHVTLPAATPFLLESAYWLQVTDNAPIVTDGVGSVAAGDYLLIETSSRWTRRSEAYLGRLLALRLPDAQKVVLASSVREQEEFEVVRQHKLTTFGVIGEARIFPLLARSEVRKKLPESTTGGPGLVRFYDDDVVGVVLQRVTLLVGSEWEF